MLPIRRVLAPNPGPYTLDGTNTWIVGLDPAAVIDPGPDDPAHLKALLQQAGALGAILVTHDHPDHALGAPSLSRASGAPVYAFRAGPAKDRLRDGREIVLGGGRLQVVHTPGHTTDHVAFFDPDGRALFTGDAVLGRGTSVIDPPEGDLALYLRSLRRMRQLRPRTIYPGHGPAVFDAVAKLDEYLEHRAHREEQVIEALRGGARTPTEIVPEIYRDYPSELHPVAARSVLAHLIKLEREGRVVHTGSGDGARFVLAEVNPCERCGRPAMPRSRLCSRCSLDVLQEVPPAVIQEEPPATPPPAG